MSTVPIVVPRVNANDDQLEFVRRIVPHGVRVAKGDAVCEVATTKAAVVVEAPDDGFVAWHADEGDVVTVGQTMGAILPHAPEASHASGDDGAAAAAVPFRLSREAERAFTAAGVSPETVGATGLVTAADVERLLGRARVEPIDFVKRAEIRTLERASSVLASSVTVPLAGAAPYSLFAVIAEAARTIRDFPHLNAWYSDGQLFVYERVDVGIAMDLGRGLRVVVVKGADALDPERIGARLEELTVRYLEGSLAPEDMEQATFTVTDLSGLGAASFQPLVGDRQSAILGISGGPAPGTPYQLTLVFDHRAANGRMAAMFLADLADRLQGNAAAASPAVPQMTMPVAAACDRCGIALAQYYEAFPRDACMQIYMRADHSQGLMCHRCMEGFF